MLRTPYEEYLLVFALGCVLAAGQRDRAAWALLGVVIASHIIVSAFLVGPIARYEVPVHPLMHIFEALAIFTAARCVVRLGRYAIAGGPCRRVPLASDIDPSSL